MGFWEDPDTKHVKVDPSLDQRLRKCSVNELVEFLSGAPLPITLKYISLLPDRKLAKKVAMHYRKADLPLISEAFFKPQPAQVSGPAEDIIDG